MESKGTLNTQTSFVLLKENKIRVLRLPGFKTYYETMVTKTLWHLHKDRLLDQWNRTLEVGPHFFGQMIFDNSTKTIQWGEESLFNK